MKTNKILNKTVTASILAVSLASAMFAVQSVFSSSPPDEIMVFRGVLKENENTVDGDRNFTASIWTQKQVGAGDKLWSEDHKNIAVDDGIFTLNLGNTTSLAKNINFTDTLYLQINVTNSTGNFNVLEPRIKMAHSPFSMASSRAATDFDLNQKKIFNGTLVNASRFSLNNDQVFINVTSGNKLTFTDAENPFGKTLGNLTGAGSIGNDTIDWVKIVDNMVLDDDTTIDMDTNNSTINFDSGTLFIDNFNNATGIGTTSPQRSLHISDVMRLEPRENPPNNPKLGDLYVQVDNSEELSLKIIKSANDAEEDKNGKMDVDDKDLDLEENKNNFVGLRFENVTIPQGSTIETTKVQFMAEDDDDAITNSTIWGEKTPNATIFDETNDNDIGERTKTSASVTWNIPDWTKEEQGDATTTPDLSNIVQEIVNQSNWNSGNSLVIIFGNFSGQRDAFPFDDSTDDNDSDKDDKGEPPSITIDFTPSNNNNDKGVLCFYDGTSWIEAIQTTVKSCD